MRTETFGGLRTRITGGTDREGGGGGPAVVLLHGFGAPGDDLVGLWRVLDAPPGTRFVFPEAPLELSMGFGDSRAWWMIDLEAIERAMATGAARDLSGETPEGLAAARETVSRMLDEACATLEVPQGQLVLGGFSQGAMLALDVALRDARPLAGLVLLSATLLSESEWTARLPARKGLPVFQSHGEQDPLLPFGMAERLRQRLEEAGLAVEWHAFRGGHEIPQTVLHALEDYMGRALAEWT